MATLSLKRISFVTIQLGLSALVAYFLIALSFTSSEQKPETAEKQAEKPKTVLATTPRASSTDPFAGLALGAKSAIVYDLAKNTAIFEKQKDSILPIASLTKLMTAHAASLILPRNATIEISAQDAELLSSAGLVAEEKWSLSELIPFMLVSSSNGAAEALARTAEDYSRRNFISEMNYRAREMGLAGTLFRNETGLDVYENAVSGSYSTAEDIAKLYGYILKHNGDILRGTNQASVTAYSQDNVRHDVLNTNWIAGKIPNLVSSKTGTTNLAGGNLAIVFEPEAGHPIVIVVLGSTPDGRFTDMEALVNATIASLNISSR